MLDSTSRLYRPSANEIERIKLEKTSRRRKMRIQQVRSMAMAHAAYTRKLYFEKQRAALTRVAYEIQNEKTCADTCTLQAKQALLDEAVRKLGEGHREARSWEDPVKNEQKEAENRQSKANERFNAAFLELMTDKAIKEWQASASFRYRAAALETEKQRAAAVAALAPPPPPPYCDSVVTCKQPNEMACTQCAGVKDADMVHKVSVNVVDGDKNCLSGPRPMSPPQVINAKMQSSETPLEEQPTAFDAAVKEEVRLKAVEQGRSIQAVEDLVKTEVRGQTAIQRVRVQQHYDSLLRRLDEIARVDFRDQKRHIASSMALYPATGEGAEALESKRERAFEKELCQQMPLKSQKELRQEMSLAPSLESSDSVPITETLVEVDADSEVVAAELTTPSVHQTDPPVKIHNPGALLRTPEMDGDQVETYTVAGSMDNSVIFPIASSLGQEQISTENLNNQAYQYSKRTPSSLGVCLATRLSPATEVTSHAPASLSRMGPGDRPEMTDFRHHFHIPTADVDSKSIKNLQEQLNQYSRTRNTIGDYSRNSGSVDFDREKEKLDLQVAEIDRQIEALRQSALARQRRLQDEGRRATPVTSMNRDPMVAFPPDSNGLPIRLQEPFFTEASGGSGSLSPTLSVSAASIADHSPFQTATTTQMLSSETREKARQLIKQQQSASQGRLTNIPKKTRVTISPARKPVEQGICPLQMTDSGTTNAILLDRNPTIWNPPATTKQLNGHTRVNVIISNTVRNAVSLPPHAFRDSGQQTLRCPTVHPIDTLSYESPHVVFFRPFPNVPSESEDVSELTEITASEPSLLSLSRTMCRAMSPSPPSETGVALVDEQSNHETEPIRLQATASTFVVAKACSPRTSTADEKPVPQFQPPLTCSVTTPPGVEDVDKSTSEISYYTPQSNRTPSHFGVAKVASPNTRYAAQDNSTLEVFVSGPSPDFRRSPLTMEGRPVGIECQWSPPSSPVVTSPPPVHLDVGKPGLPTGGSCDAIFSGISKFQSEIEDARTMPHAAFRRSFPGLSSADQAIHNSSPTLGPSFHKTSPRIPQVVTQSATTLQDGLLPCDSPSNHRRNTMSSLTLDRHIQPICLPGEGRNLSVSYPNLRGMNVQPRPGLSEPLGRSLGNFLTAPPAISSHCPSPLTSPQIVTKARPQVTLAAPQLHVPNIHSPAINTTVSVPAAEMTKSSLITAQLASIYRPSSPEISQLPSVTQHSFEPDREPVSSAVPEAAGVDLQSAPSSLLISRVESYPLSQLLSGQSTSPPPAAAGESYDCMHPLQSTSSRTSFSDVDAPTLKLKSSAKIPVCQVRSRRMVQKNQSCGAHTPPLLAVDHVNVQTAQLHNGDLRCSSSSDSDSPSSSYPLTQEELENIQYTVADRKQAILKNYLQKNLNGLRDHATTQMSSLTIEESSSTSLPTHLGTSSKTMPTSEELSSKLSSLTVSSLLPLSTSLRDIPSDVDNITSPSSPSTVFRSLPNSDSPADSSPDSPFPATWPGRALSQRNNSNQQNTVLLCRHPVHLALPTRIHRGSPWYQMQRMQFRQLSVVEEASEVDGVLLNDETICVCSPERLENQQLNSSASFPASTPASSSRPSDQFSCLSVSAAPETETKETNRGFTTITPLSRGSAGDGALSSSELTTLRYLHDMPYTPKSPTTDRSESAVSVTDSLLLTPYVTAISSSQHEYTAPVSLDSTLIVAAPDHPISTSVSISLDTASRGFVSFSTRYVEGSSARRMNDDPTLRMQFRPLSVVEEASEVDRVLLKGETLDVSSPERLENQQITSSPSLPASTPASSSRPSDQFSCLSVSVPPETETKATPTIPISRGSVGDGVTGCLSSFELTTLNYLCDVLYTPKSPTTDKSDSAVSVTDTTFCTPSLTATSSSQHEHSPPVPLDSSAPVKNHLAVVAANSRPSSSASSTLDLASHGLMSFSSGDADGSSARKMNHDPPAKSQASATPTVVDEDDVTFTELSAHMEDQIGLEGDGIETVDPSPIRRPASSASLLSFLRHEKSCSSSLETYSELRDVTSCKVPLSQSSTFLPVDVDHNECTKPLMKSTILSTSSATVVDTNSEGMPRVTITAGKQMMRAQSVEPLPPKQVDSGVQTRRKPSANKTSSAVWERLLNGTVASRAREKAIQEEMKKSDGSSRQIPIIRISKYSSRFKGPLDLNTAECNEPLDCVVEKTTNWRTQSPSNRTANGKPTDFLTIPPNHVNRPRPVTPSGNRLATSQSPPRYKAESVTGDVALLENSLIKKKSDSSTVVTPKAGPTKKSKGLLGSSPNPKDPYRASLSLRNAVASTTSHIKRSETGSSDSKKFRRSSSDPSILIEYTPFSEDKTPDLTAKTYKAFNATSMKPPNYSYRPNQLKGAKTDVPCYCEPQLKRTCSQPASSGRASTASTSSRPKQGSNHGKSAERLRREETARTNRERLRLFDQARREKMTRRTVSTSS